MSTQILYIIQIILRVGFQYIFFYLVEKDIVLTKKIFYISAGLPLTALRQSFHAALLPGQYG
jgi:hypothetical protein